MVQEEKKYHVELAKELGTLLSGTNAKNKSIMGRAEVMLGLDEVWGLWNRARGVGTCVCVRIKSHNANLMTLFYCEYYFK